MALASLGSILLALLTLTAAMIAVLALVRSSRRHPADIPSEVHAAAIRHAVIAPVAGLALAVAAMAAVTAFWPNSLPGWGEIPGLGLALAPAVGGLAWLAIHTVAERTWPRPAGTVRTASLRPRTTRGLLAHTPVWLVLVLIVHIVTLPVYAATAAGDGRQIQRVTTYADGTYSLGLSGPYPGPPYALPIFAALLLLVVASAMVVRWGVGGRPAVPGLHPEGDELLRQMSVRRILGGTQMALGATALGVNGFAALAVRHVGNSWAFWAVLAAAVVGLVATMLGLAAIVSAPQGLRSKPRHEPSMQRGDHDSRPADAER